MYIKIKPHFPTRERLNKFYQLLLLDSRISIVDWCDKKGLYKTHKSPQISILQHN